MDILVLFDYFLRQTYLPKTIFFSWLATEQCGLRLGKASFISDGFKGSLLSVIHLLGVGVKSAKQWSLRISLSLGVRANISFSVSFSSKPYLSSH